MGFYLPIYHSALQFQLIQVKNFGAILQINQRRKGFIVSLQQQQQQAVKSAERHNQHSELPQNTERNR